MNCCGLHARLAEISVLLLCIVHPILATQVQIPSSEIRAPRREPIKLGGNAGEDARRHIVYPVYPEQAKRQRIAGKVTLMLTINEEGFVYDVLGIPGNNPILEESAITAVKKWQLGPWLLVVGLIVV